MRGIFFHRCYNCIKNPYGNFSRTVDFPKISPLEEDIFQTMMEIINHNIKQLHVIHNRALQFMFFIFLSYPFFYNIH